MSQQDCRPDCGVVSFPSACTLEPAAQVALEDYARVVTGAAAAEVVEDAAGAVTGVHLCGLSRPLNGRASDDIVAFTRELLAASPGGGLGWS